MDLAVMIQIETALDWPWMEEKLKALKLQCFAHTCYALLNRWFGVSAPVEYVTLDTDFYEQITEHVFCGGVFGMDNKDNFNNAAKTALAKTNGPAWVKRLRILIRGVFPSYRLMRGYEGCEFLYDKPYLLPVAWIHRIYMLLRKDKSKSARTMKSILISEAEVANRRKLLDKMGL